MLKKSLSVAVAAAMLTLTGCGGGDSADTSSTSSTLTGGGSKGIYLGAKVVATVNGSTYETETDKDGLYSFSSLPAGDVLVEFFADADTYMVCDLANCPSSGTTYNRPTSNGFTSLTADSNATTDQVALGEIYQIQEDLTTPLLMVKTTVSAGQTISAHANVLTTMAAKLSDNNSGLSYGAAKEAVRQLIGLESSNFESIPTLDLTTLTTAQLAENTKEIQALSVAVKTLDAIITDSANTGATDISDALTYLADASKFGDIQTKATTAASGSLNFGSATSVTAPTLTGQVTLSASFLTDIAANSDAYEEQAKVQNFVTQIREFDTYATRISNNVDGFTTDVDTVLGTVDNTDGAEVMQVLGDVVGAINEAVNDYMDASDQSAFTGGTYTFNGSNYDVGFDYATKTYSVDYPSTSLFGGDTIIDVQAVATPRIVSENGCEIDTTSSTNTSCVGSDAITASITVTPNSVIKKSDGSYIATITKGTANADATGSWDQDWVGAAPNYVLSGDQTNKDIINLDLDLTVVLETDVNTDGTSEYKFTGKLLGDINNLVETNIYSWDGVLGSDGVTHISGWDKYDDTLTVSSASLTLSGNFAEVATNHELSAKVTFGITSLSNQDVDKWTFTNPIGGSGTSWNWDSYLSTFSLGKGTASIEFDASFPGLTVDSDANVKLEVSMSGTENSTDSSSAASTDTSTMTGLAKATVSYATNIVTMSYEYDANSTAADVVTVIGNQDGVKLSMYEDNNGEIVGDLYYGSHKYANVSESLGTITLDWLEVDDDTSVSYSETL